MQKNSAGTGWKLLVALLAIAGNVNAQTKNEFSLKQCVDYGMKNSFTVKNALLDMQNQVELNREITSAAYPQLSADGSFNDFFSIPTQVVPGRQFGDTVNKYDALQFGTQYQASGGFNLQQLLFDGTLFVGLQARKSALDFSAKQAEVTKEQIKANIYKLYYQLAVGEKHLIVIDTNIAQVQKQVHDTKVMYDNGFVERLDENKIVVQLNNIITQRERIRNQLRAGYVGLKFLMGMPQKDTLVLTDSITDADLQDNILDEAYSYTDRKEVQLLMLNVKLDQYNIKRYKLSALPTISAIAGYSQNAFRNDFDFFTAKIPWYQTSFVGLKFHMNLFGGFMRAAKINETKIALQKTQNTLEQAKQQIDNDVVLARLNYSTALNTIENQKKNKELAQEVYNATNLKYQQGLGSNLEIYDAQIQLTTAQDDYYSALYDAIIAHVDYLTAIGKL
jgi:outer membrane protein